MHCRFNISRTKLVIIVCIVVSNTYCVVFLFCLFFVLCIVVSNTYCVVFLLCFSSSCCQFLWFVHLFLLPLRYSLTFMYIWKSQIKMKKKQHLINSNHVLYLLKSTKKKYKNMRYLHQLYGYPSMAKR